MSSKCEFQARLARAVAAAGQLGSAPVPNPLAQSRAASPLAQHAQRLAAALGGHAKAAEGIVAVLESRDRAVMRCMATLSSGRSTLSQGLEAQAELVRVGGAGQRCALGCGTGRGGMVARVRGGHPLDGHVCLSWAKRSSMCATSPPMARSCSGSAPGMPTWHGLSR